MEYEYGFPYPVSLAYGEYFPDRSSDTETYEILATHSTDSGCLFAVTPGTKDGKASEIFHECHANRAGRWFATGRARFRVDGGANSHCVLWVRSVRPCGHTADSEPSGGENSAEEPEKPPARRTSRSRAAPAEKPDPESEDDGDPPDEGDSQA